MMVDVDRFWKGFEEGYAVAREGLSYAAGLAEDASMRAGIRLKIFTKKRQVERNFTSLGKIIYGLRKEKKENIINASKVKAVLKEIDVLETEIRKLLEKLEKEESRQPAKRSRKKPGKAKK
jgi:hypothetical protein